MAETRFDETEVPVFRGAALVMKFVGIFWIVLAAVMLATTGLATLVAVGLAVGGRGVGAMATFQLFLSLVDMAALMGAGVYTLLTAGSIQRAIEASTDPIGALMVALTNMRRLFTCYAMFVGVDLLTDLVGIAKG